jgi:hypothetical protein
VTSMSISRSPTSNAVAIAGRGSNSATPETHSNIQPKIEDSPPPNRTYDQILQRQTVLMWGSNHSRSSDDVPMSTRSPCDTPKSVNNSFANFHANSNNTLPVAAAYDKHGKEQIESIQSTPHHIKWNGNACGNNNKEVISIFPIHHNSETSSSPSASSNALHDTRYSNHTRHNEISNCEVWPAYSQYQYFPYHHVSNAHHQHPTSTQ